MPSVRAAAVKLLNSAALAKVSRCGSWAGSMRRSAGRSESETGNAMVSSYHQSLAERHGGRSLQAKTRGFCRERPPCRSTYRRFPLFANPLSLLRRLWNRGKLSAVLLGGRVDLGGPAGVAVVAGGSGYRRNFPPVGIADQRKDVEPSRRPIIHGSSVTVVFRPFSTLREVCHGERLAGQVPRRRGPV